MSRAGWALLCGSAVACFALRLLTGALLVNEAWPDEIFQTLEQAHRLAFGYGVIPWEFREGTRSWLLPGALAAPMWLGALIEPSAGHRVAVWALLCAISTVPVVVVVHRVLRVQGIWVAALVATILCTWFELVYFAPKALGEVVAGHLLLTAVFLPHTRWPLCTGLLLGTCVALRLQLAPAVLVVAVLAGRGLAPEARTRAVGGLLAAPLAAGLLDAITWSYPFQSFVANFWVNVVEGKSAQFGVAPAWAYLTAELRVLGWLAVPLWALAALGARRERLALWVLLAVLVPHSVLGHKEYRFVFPALALVAVLAALGVAELARRRRGFAIAAAAVLVAGSALRGVQLHTRDTTLGLRLYPPGSQWVNSRGALLGLAHLRDWQPLCGLGLLDVPWYVTGGYTWLHRRVPWVELQPRTLGAKASQVNALLARPRHPERLGPFERTLCYADACVYQRPGGCEPVDFDAFNRALEARDE